MTTTETLNYPVWQNLTTADVESEEKIETAGEAQLTDASGSSDLILTQSAAKGDMKAFEEIYNRHHRRVYSLCLRMLQNTAEAEDLTQEVFIQLYRKIGSFRGDSAGSLSSMRINCIELCAKTGEP